MKGDFSRRTFVIAKHYSGVRMQQGRVQVDADWNEQVEIDTHRTETETRHVIGPSGAPIHEAGFRIIRTLVDLPFPDEASLPGNEPENMPELGPGDFAISAGYYYVEGTLCRNERIVAFTAQPDGFHDAAPLGRGTWLIYLDVWQRHVTAVEDEALREIALGGPDTATRTRTVWQVKALPISLYNYYNNYYYPLAEPNCLTPVWEYDRLLLPRTATLAARTRPSGQATIDPCEVRADAGYRGLENQFYRVEIHDPPAPLALAEAVRVPAAPVASNRIERVPHAVEPLAETAPAHPTVRLREAPIKPQKLAGPALARPIASFGTVTRLGETEVYPVVLDGAFADYNGVVTIEVGPAADPMAGIVAHILRATPADGKTTLYLDVPTSQFDNQSPEVRPVSATWKWSRDNGAIVTRIDYRERDPGSTRMELTVHDLGPDDVRGIVGGVWAEIISEDHERRSAPGVIVRVADVRRLDEPVVVVDAAVSELNLVEGMQAPLRLRRWDGIGAIKYGGWIAVESGIEVRFDPSGDYRTTDFWHFPARTATSELSSGDIEWPIDSATEQPQALPPMGIEHRYARLGIVTYDGESLHVHDCRRLFPPLTELTHFFYAGGDGQEAVPNGVDLLLREPLRVGVSNGSWPVAGARVRFRVDADAGLGTLTPILSSPAEVVSPQELIVTTDIEGIAACRWTLQDDRSRPSQRVYATLLDDADFPVSQGPIAFSASLSMAERVAFYAEECAGLARARTAQAALKSLAHHTEILAAGGTAQHGSITDLLAQPPRPLPKPLTVALDFPCDEPGAYRVYFEIEGFNNGGKNGWFDAAHTVQFIQVPVSDGGLASVQWWLDPAGPAEQYATARLIDVKKNAVASQPIQFTATLLDAAHVTYDSGSCSGLANAITVQQAIQTLAARQQLVYAGGTGQHQSLADAAAQQNLLQPISVLLDGACTSSAVVVRFSADGTLTDPISSASGPTLDVKISDGKLASVSWRLDPQGGPEQHAIAQLFDTQASQLVGQPVTFVAHLDQPATGGGCEEVIPPGEALAARLRALQTDKVASACLCLLPGTHTIAGLLALSFTDSRLRHLRITACTPAARLSLGQLQIVGLGSFTLDGVTFDCPGEYKVIAPETEPPPSNLHIQACNEVTISRCRGSNTRNDISLLPLVRISSADRVWVKDNALSSERRLATGAPILDGPALVLDDGQAQAIVVNNQIDGTLFLYGYPAFAPGSLASTDLNNTTAETIKSRIAPTSTGGLFELRGNRLEQIGVHHVIVEALLTGKPSNPQITQVPVTRCFARMQMSDNVILNPRNTLAGQRLSITNSTIESSKSAPPWFWPFQPEVDANDPYLGVAFGATLVFNGNQTWVVEPPHIFRAKVLTVMGVGNLQINLNQ